MLSFAVLLSFSKHSYGFYDCGKLESLTLSSSSLNENTTYPVVVDNNVYTGFNGLEQVAAVCRSKEKKPKVYGKDTEAVTAAQPRVCRMYLHLRSAWI